MAFLVGTLTLTSGGAFAGVPADPSFQTAPQFYNGNNSQIIRSAGSDTTFYLMQQIGDLYNQAALYGCSVTGTTDFPCPTGANSSTSDVSDNWDRTEVSQGIDDVGSGDGQKQLCQKEASPDPVDFARSSKVNGNNCTGETAQGFAYDGVPEVDFTTTNPSTFGVIPSTSPYYTAVDGSTNLSANGGKAEMGPVADGWIPGNPVGGPYTGTPFLNITDNAPSTGGTTTAFTGEDSEAYRLYCLSGGSGADDQISDWGQLTNLAIPGGTFSDGSTSTGGTTLTSTNGTDFSSASVGDVVSGTGIASGTIINSVSGTSSATLSAAVVTGTASALSFTLSKQPGDGTPIGIPVNIMGVNPTSGTEFTITNDFYLSGESSLGGTCTASSGESNLNASTLKGNPHIALENNAANIGDFILSDFPNDAPDQAAELASSLYFMSEGVLLANSFARTVTVYSNGNTTGTASVFSVNKMKENGVAASSLTEGNGTLITSRVLYNMYVNQADPATQGFPRSLTFTDGATSGVTLSSPSQADFQQSDIGRGVSGSDIPSGTYITQVTSPTTSGGSSSVTLNNSTTGGSGETITLSGSYIGVRASTVGFLNWMCSTNTDGVLSKQLDHSTGLNYDAEITLLIDNSYGFNRINDTTTGIYAGNCPLIYPSDSPTGSALSNPYPGGVSALALPGAIPFPYN